jgi:hypothetical protein
METRIRILEEQLEELRVLFERTARDLERRINDVESTASEAHEIAFALRNEEGFTPEEIEKFGMSKYVQHIKDS